LCLTKGWHCLGIDEDGSKTNSSGASPTLVGREGWRLMSWISISQPFGDTRVGWVSTGLFAASPPGRTRQGSGGVEARKDPNSGPGTEFRRIKAGWGDRTVGPRARRALLPTGARMPGQLAAPQYPQNRGIMKRGLPPRPQTLPPRGSPPSRKARPTARSIGSLRKSSGPGRSLCPDEPNRRPRG
jgi:hypothetical protein